MDAVGRRVRVTVTLADVDDVLELEAGQRLGPIEVVAAGGSASRARVAFAMPVDWQVQHPSNDLKHTSLVLDLVRAELDKRGWTVDGVTTHLAALA